MIFMSYKLSTIFKPEYLFLALEHFAKESARLQQIGQQGLPDGLEDDEDSEWTPGCEENNCSDEESDGDNDGDNDGDDEDGEGAGDGHDFLATPNFDALFPPVDASKKCIPTLMIKRMWCECIREDIRVYKQKLFYGKLEIALNAYVKTVLIEPHRLDAVFEPA